MEINQYIKSLPLAERARLADRIGTTPNYLNKLAYSDKRPGAEIGVAIARHSKGAITKKQLRVWYPRLY